MGSTSKMGIPYPAATDYVSDGATDMQAIADQVDAKTGLVLIKSQTIGSAVNTVTVSSAFTSSFDNYIITVSGGVASTQVDLRLQLGSTTTGYYAAGQNVTYAGASAAYSSSNAALWVTGNGNTDTLFMRTEVFAPNLAKRTYMKTTYITGTTAGGGDMIDIAGYLNNATAYTAFTITPNTGTITGGTIRVYGYNI